MKKSLKQNYQSLVNNYCQTSDPFNSSKMRCNNHWFKNKANFTFWLNTLKQHKSPIQDSIWYSCFDSSLGHNHRLETITVNQLNQYLLAPLKQHPHLKTLKFKKIIGIDQANQSLFVLTDILYCKTSYKFNVKNELLLIPVV